MVPPFFVFSLLEDGQEDKEP